jgi:hypothetical protein
MKRLKSVCWWPLTLGFLLISLVGCGDDDEAPIVAFKNLANGSTLARGLVRVIVNANDDNEIAEVKLSINRPSPQTVEMSKEKTGNWVFFWDTEPLPGGAYLLTAEAHDEKNNVGSEAIVVNLSPDTEAP